MIDLFSSENLIAIIKAAGYLGIFGMIFSESGLLVGFFLPGDSLLFTAGFLASQSYLNIYILITIVFIAAVVGDNVGYAFGSKVGKKIFTKEESRFFRKDNLLKASDFYEKHGSKTVVLARFIPFVRTFAPIVAGVGKMHYQTFLAYNILGGFLWAISIPLLGLYLGNLIPNVDKYILPIIFLIIILSILPSIIFALQQYISSVIRKNKNRK